MSDRPLTAAEQAEVERIMHRVNDASVTSVRVMLAALVRRLGDAEREMAVTHKTNVVLQEMTNDYLARMKHAEIALRRAETERDPLNPFPWEAE